MAFTFSEANTFRNVGIGTIDNKVIIMNVSKSKENLSFHSTTNDTSIDIMSIKTILNKDPNDELNISGYDGQFINPIIKINNTNQEINITSNLNIVRNLNVAHNVVIDGMANNDEYVLDIKNQDRKNCVVAIRSHLDSNIYDFSYPSLLFSQYEDIIQTSIGLGPRSYNTGYGNINNSTFYIEQKNKSGIRFAVDCDSDDGGKEMLFLDGNNLGVYIRQNTDILGNLNISHNLNIDNLTITHNSISTNAHPHEIAFLNNTLKDISLISTTNASIDTGIIEGGFINNTVIGNTTPNTGKFTTLNTTSNATINGDLFLPSPHGISNPSDYHNRIFFTNSATDANGWSIGHYQDTSTINGLQYVGYGGDYVAHRFKSSSSISGESEPIIMDLYNDKINIKKPIWMNSNAINFYNLVNTDHQILHSFGSPTSTEETQTMNGILIRGWGNHVPFCRFQGTSPSDDVDVMDISIDKVEIKKDTYITGELDVSGYGYFKGSGFNELKTTAGVGFRFAFWSVCRYAINFYKC